jgi:hypothetical protein
MARRRFAKEVIGKIIIRTASRNITQGTKDRTYQFFLRHIELTAKQRQLIRMPLVDLLGVSRDVSQPWQGLHLERSWSQGLTQSVSAMVD